MYNTKFAMLTLTKDTEDPDVQEVLEVSVIPPEQSFDDQKILTWIKTVLGTAQVPIPEGWTLEKISIESLN